MVVCFKYSRLSDKDKKNSLEENSLDCILHMQVYVWLRI